MLDELFSVVVGVLGGASEIAAASKAKEREQEQLAVAKETLELLRRQAGLPPVPKPPPPIVNRPPGSPFSDR